MKHSEQKRFNKLYNLHLRALKLQGMSDSTSDVYARAIRRLSERFDCVPDKITADQLATHFSELVDSHSWSTVKVDRCGIQFFWKYVLKRDWKWIDIVKAPKVHSLPDVFSVAEIRLLLVTTDLLRYRTFILCTYCMGLRLAETLNLQISDIDAANQRVHIRRGKGHKDRFVPLPDLVLQQMRLMWASHRHPKFIFPSTKSLPNIQHATGHMSRGTTQKAFNEIVQQCGIKKKFQSTPFVIAMPRICLSLVSACVACKAYLATPAPRPLHATPI